MKGDVNGPNTRPTYRFLKANGILGDVAWNFAGKFMVDKEGKGKSNSLSYLHCIQLILCNFCCILHGIVYPVKSEKNLESDILRLTQS